MKSVILVHYYNYIDDCMDFTIYPHTRFAAEYGYQSWPSFHTVKKISIEEDWFYGSEFWRHRQHKIEGFCVSGPLIPDS